MATVAQYGSIQLMSGEVALILRELSIHATLVGGLSETTVEMLFENPASRSLEGTMTEADSCR